MNTELDQLLGIAAETDTAAAPPELTPDGQPVPPPVNYGFESRKMVDMFAGLVAGYAPETAEIWSEAGRSAAAMSLAPVLEKYGTTVSNLPVEIVAIFTVGPMLYRTSKIVAAKMSADKANAKSKPEAVTAPPAAPIDSPEQKVHPQVALYR